MLDRRSPMRSILRSLERRVSWEGYPSHWPDDARSWPSIARAERAKRKKSPTYYWVDIRTRCCDSLGFWPAPVELHFRRAVRQLEQGDCLSQRICIR
jgi:hypothetical protein